MGRYISANKVKELMNKAGSLSRTFLFAVDYEMERGIFIENPLDQTEVLFRLGEVKNFAELSYPADNASLRIKRLISYHNYARKFKKIIDGLQRGDSYLANLTVKTKVETEMLLREIMASSNSFYGLCAWEDFVSFSPERFLRIENGIISSCPMKGTIDASVPNAADIIRDDYKELCEHNTIVDLIRNDLGMVSESVWVERFRYIDRIQTDRRDIFQVSSEIRGRLSKEYSNRLGDILFALLPAGSVSGAPKLSTVKLISGAEGGKRGFYTGVFGYFDGRLFDSAVLIRYIQRDKNGKLFYRSGGGITVNSICENEYNEIIEKIYLPQTRS